MGVRKGDTITIHYRGRFDTGEEFDNSFSREPVVFTVGNGQVVEAIDDGVQGLEPGEHRRIKVNPEDGFGPRRDELIRTVPKNMLGDEVVEPGEAVEIQTDDGQVLIAEVKAIDDESITFDLNHPLAGRNIEFEVELLGIEEKAA
ncbi:MAG: FKBP-type peptidyl-prolyl cis-trans isomerase [Actinomycetota bacterium]|nr:FKBP-type peptidyl-prolyl cis-trans isomerase [Actinomycetota bacterium]